MFLISSGDSKPNCISWIVRNGASERVKIRLAMVKAFVCQMVKVRWWWRTRETSKNRRLADDANGT